MEIDRSNIPSLLIEAHEQVENDRREQSSIDEAQKHVKDLEDKVKSLLMGDSADETGTVDVKEDTAKSLFERLAEVTKHRYESKRVTFMVPMGDNDPISVEISQGKRSQPVSGYVDKGFEVDIKPLDYILRIDKNKATVNSKYNKPSHFDRNTPIGPAPNLGPLWHRDMNMEDLSNYSQLLDRLAQSDVKRV